MADKIISQCSSRCASDAPEDCSREPYSDSILQIRLKSLIVCSDCVRARIYISELLSLYKVLDPWYMPPRSPAADITPSMEAKENSLKSVLFAGGSSSGACSCETEAILSLTFPRRFRISSAPSSLREAASRLLSSLRLP